MPKEHLTDVYIMLKDLHYFTNFVQSKVTRKEIKEQAYILHTKYETLIQDYKNNLEKLYD